MPVADVRRAVGMVAWWQVAGQLLSAGSLAVLFRLLGPDVFGLLGMVMPIVLLMRSLATAGLNVATVQQVGIHREHVSSLFWLNLVLGLAAALLTLALAPVAARAYATPDVLPVLAVLGGTSLVAVLGVQHQALLEKELRFGRLSAIRFAAVTGGAAFAVAFALANAGIWALVVQQYVELMLLAGGCWLFHPWRPRRPRRGIASLVRFGSWYTLSGLLFDLTWNGHKLLLAAAAGHLPGGHAVVGFYTQAWNLMIKPVYLVTTPVTAVMLPALARSRQRTAPAAQREAESAQRDFAATAAWFYRLTGIILLPCGAGLFLVAEDAMHVLGGDVWSDAGRLLVQFAPLIPVVGWISISGSLLAARGNSRLLAVLALLLCASVLSASTIVLGLTALAPAMELAQVVGGTVTATIAALLIPYLLTCFGATRTARADMLSALSAPVVPSAVMLAGVWLTRHFFNTWIDGPLTGDATTTAAIRLAVSITVGVLVYAACVGPTARHLWFGRR